MPKLLARGEDDSSVSSDEESIAECIEKHPEHELIFPIACDHHDESDKSTQLDEEENETALPSRSMPNQFHLLSSEGI